MSIIRDMLDFIFPLMPSDLRREKVDLINQSNISGEGEILVRKVDVAQRYYDEEDLRAKTIEGKASMFITSTGFLGTVLIGTSTFLISKSGNTGPYNTLVVICLLAFVLYMVGTILYSLKTLQRTIHYYPDPHFDVTDIDELNKKRICDYVNSSLLNQNVTNQKVDYVVQAQRCFKRAMLSLVLYVIILVLYVANRNGFIISRCLETIKSEAGTWYITGVLLLVIALILSITLLFKYNKNN